MKQQILSAIIFLTALTSSRAQLTHSKIEEAVKTFVEQDKFTGSVLVAKDGKIIFQNGYGYRDIDKKQPNSTKTIYQVASIAKQFTATVILKLQADGKLNVHDKLSKYYPDYPNGDKITIRHLLSHSSGIYNYTENRAFMSSDQSSPVTLDFMINLFKNKPLLFEPGSKFSYSNSGYIMLGYIIEKITGAPYQKVLEDLILRPLKLTNTGYDYNGLRNRNKSVGYNQYKKENYSLAKYVNPSILYTTGALYSNVDNLYAWHKALMDTNFISPKIVQEMYTPVAGPYGYGWQVDSLFGKKRVSHSGNVSGFKSNINRIPEDDVCVIVLSNSNSSQVGQLAMILLSIVYEKPYQLPVVRKSVSLDPEVLRNYTGTYQFDTQMSIRISLAGSKLYAEPTNQPKFEILAENQTSFFIQDFDIQFEFKQSSKDGIFDTLLFTMNKMSMSGKKIK